MQLMTVRKIELDGMAYRPDEEIPEGVFRMRGDRADPENDDDSTPFTTLTVREIVLYGFLAGALGAAVGALAGLVLAADWPAPATTLSGATLASIVGWFAIGRQG